MFSSLSKSVKIMNIFDLLVYVISTLLWCDYFKFSANVSYWIIPLIVFLGILIIFLKGNYKIREFNITGKNTYLLLEGVVLAHIIPLLILFFSIGKLVSFKFAVCNIITVFLVLEIYRVIFHYYLFNLKKIKNILILGTNTKAEILANEIQNKKALRMNVIGFVRLNSEETVDLNSDLPIFSNLRNLSDIIVDKNIDIVVIAEPTALILSIPQNVKLYKMPDFYEMTTGKYYIDEKTITELYYQYVKSRSKAYDVLKRIYDIIAALIILVVTLPITLYIAIRVKMTDGASPIFTQKRVGKGGKTFECYKLRTMYVNDYVPKNANDVKYAESIKSDDRIIPFCRFVRKARFDEIPQMINILKGEMSIVGPRAEWEDEVKIFEEEIPYYNCRMWVKTGWTGWSHINMNSVFTVVEEKERLAHDLYYIKHRNVLWEICILLKAVFLALGGRHK